MVEEIIVAKCNTGGNMSDIKKSTIFQIQTDESKKFLLRACEKSPEFNTNFKNFLKKGVSEKSITEFLKTTSGVQTSWWNYGAFTINLEDLGTINVSLIRYTFNLSLKKS